MSNIDKQALREAANAANAASWGNWESYKPHKGARGYEVKVGVKAVAQHCLKVDSVFIASANPATVLALLDELEAKDKSISFLKDQLAQLANFNPDWDKLEAATDSLREHMAELTAARKRIAELEAVTSEQRAEHDAGMKEFAAMLQGAEPAKGWIPCSDRMPDTMISVLVTGDWFHHAVSFWDGASWCDLDFEPPVTHWMPLPAAPQQEVNNG